jgi:hypothetical protein
MLTATPVVDPLWSRDVVFWAVLGAVLLVIIVFLAATKLGRWLRSRSHEGRGMFTRHCRHCQEVAWLRETTQALAVKDVQVDAARENLKLVCDAARDHLAVLAAIRAELESFRAGWDLVPDTFEGIPGRHGVDTLTAAMTAIPARPSPTPRLTTSNGPRAY